MPSRKRSTRRKSKSRSHKRSTRRSHKRSTRRSHSRKRCMSRRSKAPAIPAKFLAPGTKRMGKSRKRYEVRVNKNGTKYWFKCGSRNSPCFSPRNRGDLPFGEHYGVYGPNAFI